MNDKMKTAISIIAIACLCACASPTKQPLIQTSRTAKEALEDYFQNVSLDDTSNRLRRIQYAPYSDETLIFIYQGFLKQKEKENLPKLQTNEGKELLTSWIRLLTEMRDRKILTSETINVVLTNDQIAQAYKELSAQDVLPKNE